MISISLISAYGFSFKYCEGVIPISFLILNAAIPCFTRIAMSTSFRGWKEQHALWSEFFSSLLIFLSHSCTFSVSYLYLPIWNGDSTSNLVPTITYLSSSVVWGTLNIVKFSFQSSAPHSITRHLGGTKTLIRSQPQKPYIPMCSKLMGRFAEMRLLHAVKAYSSIRITVFEKITLLML